MGDESRSAEEIWADCLEPFTAVRMLVEAGIGDQEQAVNWLKGRLKDGTLRALGWERERDEHTLQVIRDPVTKKVKKQVVRYAASEWKYVHLVDYKDDLWISGTHFPAQMPNPKDFDEFIKPGFFSVVERIRFDPGPVEEFCRRAAPNPVQKSVLPRQAGAGGRPPKPFWDQLWPFIAAALYNGDLKPARQADIERAMSDWLAANGHDAGESTVRRAARALWQAISREDQN